MNGMSSFTSPMGAGATGVANLGGYGGGRVSATAPSAMGGMIAGMPAVGAPAVASGVATQYWVELVAYPPGSTASLWLLVGGIWKRYDNPPSYMSQVVQEGFLGGATVRVWYDGEPIVGLVVSK
jgi:hypothetical protein